MIDEFDEYMKKVKEEEERERREYLDTFFSKVSDDKDLLYQGFLLLICKRFDLSFDYGIPSVAYNLLEYFVENVTVPFTEWLYSDDAPFVRTVREIKKIFYEIPCDDIHELVDIVNTIYGLDLITDDMFDDVEYVYSYSFNFNSFTPLPVGEIKDLMNEIRVLEKHGYPTEDLKARLDSYGLSEEQLLKL